MNWKQGLALALMLFNLAGCGPSGDEVTDEYRSSTSMPDGLKDCRFFEVERHLVIRCPRSETNVIDKARTPKHSAVIED